MLFRSIYIPHETEYIYLKGFKDFVGAVSLHKTEWPKPETVNKELLVFGETIKNAIAEVRKYKSENNLSMRTEMESAVIIGSAGHAEWLKETEKDFVACNHVQKIIYDLK